VPAGSASAELRETGSRFFAFVARAESVAAAKAFVDELTRRYPDATHVCFAWRIGWPPAERSADAGEPAGTAGPPLLAALRSAGLTDVVAAVVRYFGGTKLGKGGLVRAYGGALRAALEGLATREESPRIRLAVELPYERVGAIKRLLRPGRVELAEESYGEAARLVLAVEPGDRAGLDEALAALGIVAREVS
jgi:uncharacterized YigZ family protein